MAQAQRAGAMGRVLRGAGPGAGARGRRGGSSMRKGVVVLVLLVLAIQSPQRVEAGAFATEITQLLNHAQLVMEYIRQGEQLANELNMYIDMVKNSRTLSAHSF